MGGVDGDLVTYGDPLEIAMFWSNFGELKCDITANITMKQLTWDFSWRYRYSTLEIETALFVEPQKAPWNGEGNLRCDRMASGYAHYRWD